MGIPNSLFRFWAKTSDDPEVRPNAYHPLICHLIDVAATTEAVWTLVLPEVTKKRLAAPFGLEAGLPEAGKFVSFLAGLHDLGKCSPPFTLRGKNDGPDNQTRRLLELYVNTDCDCEQFQRAFEVPHGFVTATELPAILQSKFYIPKRLSESVAEIIGGHHGIFASSDRLSNIRRAGKASIGDDAWKEARFDVVETLARYLNVRGHFTHITDAKLANSTAMIFAGLTTVADWIGSNIEFFPCEVDDSTTEFKLDLDLYTVKARDNAARALKTLGWTNWIRDVKPISFEAMFPGISVKRDLQESSIDIAENDLTETGIVVIESPMGEGKTEAAMYLADAFNSRLGTRGIYFALPTQATSNQMFGRVNDYLEHRFGGDRADVHLILQHGHASISEEFEEKINNFYRLKNLYDDDAKGNFSNIVAAEWFTYKKRGLLVPFGVGTIDQILLAALQTKHVFVRLFGLAHKAIIIDEVHAYDAYMSTVLERLLEWLAALGSPVIILSATLPRKKRDALIKAYLKGLGKISSEEMPATADIDTYPRISFADASMPHRKFRTRQIQTSDQNTKTLNIVWNDESDLVQALKSKLANGGCAAIICNTVRKAQETFALLEQHGMFQGNADDGKPKLDLLHSRFRFKDRDEREKRCLLRFGKPGGTVTVSVDGKPVEATVRRPDFAVLVSTQIIEQSLDLDFDLMVSELAPADLLLQRAGRLQRHDRVRLADFADGPELWLIKPETDDNGDLIAKKGLPDFGLGGYVYDKNILLRTWLKLRHTSRIDIPGDIEPLIEHVYNDDISADCLNELESSYWHATRSEYLAALALERNAAQLRYIKNPGFSGHLGRLLGEPKEEDAAELHPALQAMTRLIEPTANVVCLWEKEGRLYADESCWEAVSLEDRPSKNLTKKLLFNSLSVSAKSIVFSLFNQPVPKGWQQSPLLRRHRELIFDTRRRCEMFGHIFILDEKLGLRVLKK